MKKFVSLTLAVLLILACALPASAAMADVGNHWGAPAIQYCLDNGYMNGMSAAVFQPNGPVTRAQVAQVLYNLSGRPDVSDLDSPFADSQTHWAADAIQWAKSTGVVLGVSDTEFAPETKVTRAQAATMFNRYAGLDSSNTHNHFTVDTAVLNLYPDGSQVASWYKEGVSWAVQYGFMQGSGGKLNPTGTLTRAQLAQFINNYFEPQEGLQVEPGDKYPTVQAFLEDPTIHDMLQSMIDSMDLGTMNVELYGDDDTLHYEFYFGEADLNRVSDLDALGQKLEEMLTQDDIADIFIHIAEAMTLVVDVDNPKVEVTYYTFEGEVLASVLYFAK